MNRTTLPPIPLVVLAAHAAAGGYAELTLAPLAGDPVFEHAARPGQYDHYGTATGSFTGTGTLAPGIYELTAKSWCRDEAYNDTAESWSDLDFDLDLGTVDNTAFHDSASSILCSWNQDWYGWGHDQDDQTGLSSWAADVISYPVVGVVTGSMSFDFENTVDGRRAFLASFDNDIDVRGFGSDAWA